MTDKLFTIAGTATVNGVNTLRFATGKARVREGVLRRAGFSDIQLFDLPTAMNRQDAAAWLAAKGISGVVPVKGGQGKPLELTAEQRRAAEAEAKRAAFVQRMAEARAAKAAARRAAEDHNFIAEITGEAKVEVPEAEDSGPAEVADEPVTNIDEVEALLGEGGVDHEREIASQG